MDNQLEQRQQQINKLQANLSYIRKIAGWTAEVLAQKIGVTKQTISNLENKKTSMNFTQFIAIRSVLDVEIEQNKENKVLPQVIAILLDSNYELDNEEIQESVETVSAVAKGGIKGTELLNILKVLSPLMIALLGTVRIDDWKKLLK